MKHIEMLNVEFGDCTVLVGNHSNILMVDCGSMNNRLRRPEMDIRQVFSFIRNRYLAAGRREFLLTHYHRDHICGLWNILRENPHYFGRIYIPVLPLDKDGGNPLVELSIYAFIFLSGQTDCAQINTACLTIFSRLREAVGTDNIFTLSQGDCFTFDGTEYQVVSPQRDNFTFAGSIYSAIEEMRKISASAELQENISHVLHTYNSCITEFSASSAISFQKRLLALDALEEAISSTKRLREKLTVPSICNQISEIFGGRSFSQDYSEAANSASIVFHNKVHQGTASDILMTGDAPITESMSELLHESYFAAKAPHHGTASGYSNFFAQLSANVSHILISNGDYRDDTSIYPGYTNLEAIKHCTNHTNCQYYIENGSCCNRLSFCYDQPAGTDLALRCAATRNPSVAPYCKIYVITPAEGRSCFCE